MTEPDPDPDAPAPCTPMVTTDGSPRRATFDATHPTAVSWSGRRTTATSAPPTTTPGLTATPTAIHRTERGTPRDPDDGCASGGTEVAMASTPDQGRLID